MPASTCASNDNNFGFSSFSGGATKKQTFTCKTCGITCHSEINFKQHLEGAKHKQRELQKGNASLWGQKSQPYAVNSSPFVPSKGVFSSNNVSFAPAQMKKEDRSTAVNVTPSFAPALSKKGPSFDFAPKKECGFSFNRPATNFQGVAQSKGIFSFERTSNNNGKGPFAFCSENNTARSSPLEPSKDTCTTNPFLFSGGAKACNNLQKSKQAGLTFTTADTTKSPPTHPKESHNHVTCDGCGMFPLIGVRYRCSMCPNYDLCETCINAREQTHQPHLKMQHEPSHLFLRIAKNDPKYESYPVVMNRCNAIHHGIVCDGCSAKDIQGYRYQCQICPDLDFCEACEAKGVHDMSHPRIKMSVPRSNPKAI